MCTAVNILLHKSDGPMTREFLQTHVVNGGAIPKCPQHCDYYPAEYLTFAKQKKLICKRYM